MYFKRNGTKYNAKKIAGFDSKKEWRRYGELTMLERAGKITDLRTQVKYILIPAQREPDIMGPRGGRKPGKLIEHECSYVADFVYHDLATGETVVEDVKGYKGGAGYNIFSIKRKLMLFIYNIRVREV